MIEREQGVGNLKNKVKTLETKVELEENFED